MWQHFVDFYSCDPNHAEPMYSIVNLSRRVKVMLYGTMALCSIVECVCVIYDDRLSTLEIQSRGEMPSVQVFLRYTNPYLHNVTQGSKKTILNSKRLGWLMRLDSNPAIPSTSIESITCQPQVGRSMVDRETDCIIPAIPTRRLADTSVNKLIQ